ncbi:hypothetical protein [Methylorubrum populi]
MAFSYVFSSTQAGQDSNVVSANQLIAQGTKMQTTWKFLLKFCLPALAQLMICGTLDAAEAQSNKEFPCEFTDIEAKQVEINQAVSHVDSLLRCRGFPVQKTVSETNIELGSPFTPHVWKSKNGIEIKASILNGEIMDFHIVNRVR